MRAHPAGPRHGEVLSSPNAPAIPSGDPAALDAAVWPLGAHRNGQGALVVGGVDVRDAARDFGTPLFLLDEADFRARAAAFRVAYDPGRTDVYYAAKAFLCTTIARWAVEEGLGIDVASGGELAVAVAAGVPGGRLLLHGNNKSRGEIRRALESGVGRIVVDAPAEVDRIAEVARDMGVRASVLVRVTVGVEAHTHEFIATAHEDQKFGLSLASGAAYDVIMRIAGVDVLDFRGVHSHIGSQIFDAAGFEVAAMRLVGLMGELHAEGIEVAELNLGGGMGIAYVSDDDPLEAGAMAKAIESIVDEACARAHLPVPRLAFEPGRAIVGPSAITVYEVGTVKPVELDHGHQRVYVSVDGGMSDNIRTALYDADYTVTLASRVSTAAPMLCRVVGKHCESGDVVVRDAWLPGDLRAGDLLAVAATGAYCRSMASQYNYLPRPAVVAARDGNCTVMLRRETEEDLLALDPGAAV
ncbi:MAG: diaminopimelate decarboxylase [Actinomycetota bacterium]